MSSSIAGIDDFDSAGVLRTSNLFHIQEQQPSGTDGGSTSVGDNVRPLNTVIVNNIAGASLSSNQPTLPEGDYFVKFTGQYSKANSNRHKLYNVTDSLVEVLGMSEFVNSTTGFDKGVFEGTFTISGTKAFEVRFYVSNAQATDGLGVAVSDGEVEIYSDIKFWKVD